MTSEARGIELNMGRVGLEPTTMGLNVRSGPVLSRPQSSHCSFAGACLDSLSEESSWTTRLVFPPTGALVVFGMEVRSGDPPGLSLQVESRSRHFELPPPGHRLGIPVGLVGHFACPSSGKVAAAQRGKSAAGVGARIGRVGD